MNHIYRTVWNEVSRAFVAVAEIVRGRGRGGRSRKSASVVAGDDTSRGSMGTRSAAGASRRQGLSPAAPRPMALEQRFMFDGAAVADAAATLADHPAWAEPATEVPDAPNATPAEARSVAFIDATLPEAQALAAGMAPDVHVVMLEPGSDPWQQMSDALAARSGVESVHLISHGNAQGLVIGGRTFDTAQLALRADLLQGWRDHLRPQADLLLYGCDVGVEGADSPLLQLLARTTGADVAASADTTTPLAQGGNTVLEVATGTIESAASALQGLQGPLAATSITDANAGFTRITPEDTEVAVSGISVTDTDNPAHLTVRVQTTGGTGRIATLGSASISAGSNGSADLTLSGSLTAVNSALASLHYTPELNKNASTTGFAPKIDLTGTDVSNTGTPATLTVSPFSVPRRVTPPPTARA
jgi:hypothetical protein